MEEYAKAGKVMEMVNGESIDGVSNPEELEEHRLSMFTITHFSAIEAYIMTPEAQNANLIAYLRGETNTLTL
jgi:hypothetical protein